MILCYVDAKTTGYDVKRCNLIQLTGCIEKDGVVVEKFSFKMKPYTSDVEIYKDALEKGGFTQDQIYTFDDYKDCFNQFWDIIETYGDRFSKKTDEKIFLVGYNVQFVVDFMLQWFKENSANKKEYLYGNGFFNMFFIPGIDVMQFAMASLMEKRIGMENFQLGTVCKKFGLSWDDEEAKDAMYVVKKIRALFHTLTGRKYLERKTE